MRVIDFMNIKSGGYHEPQIAYNMLLLVADIKRAYPNDTNPNFSDPKYKEIIENHPFAPLLSGSLAHSLGISNEVLTLDLWRDLSNGYCPAHYLPKDSPLQHRVIDTERGPMVKLNKNPTPIVAGEYRPDLQSKDKRIGTEFVFGLGQNTSNALTALAIADPSAEKRFADIAKDIFVSHIIPQMEVDALVRKGTDGAEIDYSNGLLISVFQHIENRGTEEFGPEPYRHFHFDILNTAMGEEDGELYSVMNDLICKNKEVYTAIFQEHLKPALEKEFGFTFKPVYLDEDRDNKFIDDIEKNVTSWDVDDKFLPASLRNELGKRTEAMTQYMKDEGFSGELAMEIARKETRDDKTELSPSELKANWAEWYQRHGFSAESMRKHQNFNQVKPSNPVLPSGELLVSNFMRKHKDVAFTEDQFKAHVSKQLLGVTTGEKAREYAEKIFNEQGVQMMEPEKQTYYQDFIDGKISDPREYKQKQIRFGRDVQFTTKRTLEMDRYVVESSLARKEETKFMLDRQKITKAIIAFEKAQKPYEGKAFQFAVGQKEAAIAAMTEAGSIINIAGRAGAGKSTLLKVVVQQYEKAGYEVIGTSTSDQATKELAKSTGMDAEKCCNTSELFHAFKVGSYQFKPNTVCIVDEAGMADGETFYKLVKASNEAGAKLILVGEKEQLQSVGASGLFKTLNERFITKPVTEINRQREKLHREMVEDFACGRSKDGVDKLVVGGCVIVKETNQGRLEQLVKDYLEDKNAFNEKFIVAATNMDCDTINDAIRARLKKDGKLSGPEAQIKGKDGFSRMFSEGDRVIFTKKQESHNAGVKGVKISNSSTGTVVGFTRKTTGELNTIKLKLDNGEEHFLNLGQTLNIKHGYAGTVHKSQGSTKESVFYWVSPTINNLHQAYVACSRHRSNFKMYLSLDMVDRMAGKMEGKAPTPGMLKLAESIAKDKKIELEPSMSKSFIETRNFLNLHTYELEGKKPSVGGVLEQFKQITQAMGQAAFKRSTYDYSLGGEKELSAYQEVRNYLKARLGKSPTPVQTPQATPTLVATHVAAPTPKATQLSIGVLKKVKTAVNDQQIKPASDYFKQNLEKLKEIEERIKNKPKQTQRKGIRR